MCVSETGVQETVLLSFYSRMDIINSRALNFANSYQENGLRLRSPKAIIP